MTKTRSKSFSRKRCAGITIKAGVTIIIIGDAGTGTGDAGVAGTASPLLAPPLRESPLLASAVLVLSVAAYPSCIPLIGGQRGQPRPTKTPREAGFCLRSQCKRLVRAAAAVAPDQAVGAAGAGPHHNDRGRPDHDNAAAIGLAATVGAAVPTRAASSGGVRGAKACERAGDQNCRKKILHAFSHDSGSHHTAPQKSQTR